MPLASDDMSRSYTILFLIADTGAGHRRAAEAICQAIRLLTLEPNQIDPDRYLTYQECLPPATTPWGHRYQLECVDAFATCGEFPLAKLNQLYGFCIRYAPWLYGTLFHLTNHTVSFRLLERLIYRLLHRRLAELLGGLRPDVIVSIHPLLSHVAVRVQAELNRQVPILTVMTDLATPHTGWMATKVDGCIVPTETVREVCRRHGMPERAIQMLGMPIDLAFSRSLEHIGAGGELSPLSSLPTVLLVGGGEGSGKLAQLAGAIWQADLPLRLIIVAGRNRRLKRRLERSSLRFSSARQRGCHILGFVENMDELMRAADVIVTKAGPGTICEAIACRLPIVLSGYVPGQEEGNVTYVCEQGIGILAETPEKLVAALRECWRPGSQLLEQMRTNMDGLQNPVASLAIARFILGASSPHAVEGSRDAIADAV